MVHVRISSKSMSIEAATEDNFSLGTGLSFLDDKTSTAEVVKGLETDETRPTVPARFAILRVARLLPEFGRPIMSKRGGVWLRETRL